MTDAGQRLIEDLRSTFCPSPRIEALLTDAADEIERLRGDAARLDFMINGSNYVAHSRDGDDCWLMLDDGHDDHERVAQDGTFSNGRDAIDAAMAARNEKEK